MKNVAMCGSIKNLFLGVRKMAGYNGFSKSNNAIKAEQKGKLQMKKTGSKRMKSLTYLETAHLMQRLHSDCYHQNQAGRATKYYAMATLMLESGLRIGEVLRLLRVDLMFGSEPVNSLILDCFQAEKGGARTVPLSNACKEAIKYLSQTVWAEEDKTPLYQALTPLEKGRLTAFNSPNSTRPMSARQVQRHIKRISKESLGFCITPHQLRHTFATRMLRVTNIRVVQELLGHSSITSTQVYTHPAAEDLQEAINSINAYQAKERIKENG